LQLNYTIFPLGDSALTIDFGGLSLKNNQLLLALFDVLKQENISAVRDVIPAYSSLTVVYDTVKILSSVTHHDSAFEWMRAKIEMKLLGLEMEENNYHGQTIEIPVCYHTSVAPDIEFVASSNKIAVKDVVEIHTSITYRVYMIGFLPGFAYMASVDKRIVTPRKHEPRKSVAAGSVGIAGEQTGIYPLNSPGGWQLIGKTPVRLFDASKEQPTLLKPGDQVKFYHISLEEYKQFVQP
jgi:inhibitor of KinA